MQHFRGLRRRGHSQFDALKFLFFPFFVTPTGRIFGHIPMENTSLHVVPRPFVVSKMKFES